MKKKQIWTDTSTNGRLEALERRVGELEKENGNINKRFIGLEDFVTEKPQEYCECKKPDYSRIMGNHCKRCHRETKPLKPQNTEVLRKKIRRALFIEDTEDCIDAILRLVKNI